MRRIFRNIVLTIGGSLKSPKAGIHIINSHYVMPGEVNVKKFEIIYEDYIKYFLSFGKIINIEDAVMLIVNNEIQEKGQAESRKGVQEALLARSQMYFQYTPEV